MTNKWKKVGSRLLVFTFTLSILCTSGFLDCPKFLVSKEKIKSIHDVSLNDLPCHKNREGKKANSTDSKSSSNCSCSNDFTYISIEKNAELKIRFYFSNHTLLILSNVPELFNIKTIFQRYSPPSHLSLSIPTKTIRLLI
ncbi:MAG: hypothetical protein SH817_08065 [Leptospira sp.]|nr:hypothetical protein [Leptospira sp.]